MHRLFKCGFIATKHIHRQLTGAPKLCKAIVCDDVEDTFLKRRRRRFQTVRKCIQLTKQEKNLKMRKSQKYDEAQQFSRHAVDLQPLHPDVLTHYGEYIEEIKNDIINSGNVYNRALTVKPEHSQALVNRKRTLSVLDEMDKQELENINAKLIQLIQLNQNNPSLKRVKKELYFQQIYHTVAIEGNTMTLAEIRRVIKDRRMVRGKSTREHDEILGLESALIYINRTLVDKDVITVFDILEIHKHVLGCVDPIEAGSFRQTQVFVGKHIPPIASEVAYLMEEFVEWLQSERMLELHPVEQAALAHYKFVYIHPFVDGNGRTARLLMNLILMRNGYPPVIIRRQESSLYFNCIQLADEEDTRPFIRFIALATKCILNVYLQAEKYGDKCLMALKPEKRDCNNVIPL